MSVHINEVLSYLDAHPIHSVEVGVESLLEMLHEVYTMYNARKCGPCSKSCGPLWSPSPAGTGTRCFRRSATCAWSMSSWPFLRASWRGCS